MDMGDIICLNQWRKPTGPKIKIKGVGDCDKCIPHKDNKKCKNYWPITKPAEIEIKERN